MRNGRSADSLIGAFVSSPVSLTLGLLSLPITYYAYTETYRYLHLRSRQKLWNSYLTGCLSGLSLREAVQARFGILKCFLTGRYLNVTWEWKEQNILEFLFHQLIQKPLTGKLWWKGGYDETRDSHKLDWREVDTVELASKKGIGKKASVSSSLETDKDSGNISASEEDWEAVEASTSQLKSGLSNTTSKPSEERPGDEESIAITWLGQSTCLIQLQGHTILTDPCFSPQPLETPFAPTRIKPIPLSLSSLCSLKLVDLVLVSHNHFDHLDVNCIKPLNESSSPIWVVPLGLKKFMLSYGVSEEKVVEMTWWEEKDLLGFQIACTPAQHWSGRNPWDSNRSLWCGFVVKSLRDPHLSFFHAGDTGYSEELYSSIGKLYAPISLGILPIGAYHPRWMMSSVHTDPQGAIAIHKHLGIQESIAVHWATWVMSDEEWWEPKAVLEQERKGERIYTVGLGERKSITAKRT